MEVQTVQRWSRIGPNPRARLAQASAAGRLAVRPAPSGNGRFPQVRMPFGPNLDRNRPRIIVIWIFHVGVRVHVISRCLVDSETHPQARPSEDSLHEHVVAGPLSMRIYRCCDGSDDLTSAEHELRHLGGVDRFGPRGFGDEDIVELGPFHGAGPSRRHQLGRPMHDRHPQGAPPRTGRSPQSRLTAASARTAPPQPVKAWVIRSAPGS